MSLPKAIHVLEECVSPPTMNSPDPANAETTHTSYGANGR